MNAGSPMPAAARLAAGLGTASAAALGFETLHAPLPWMLGPLVAVAALQIAGPSVAPPEPTRRIGQLVVGSAVGLAFQPEVARMTLTLWPLVLANAVGATLLGLGSAWLLHRLTRADRRTCYFSSVVGGAWEMVALAERFGAQPDKVAAAHALRISLVVLLVPLAYWLLGVEGDFVVAAATRPPVSPLGLALLLSLTASVAWLADRRGIANAWVIAPMVLSAALTAGGARFGSMPTMLLHAGQLLIGWSMGSRFSRDFFRRSPMFLAGVAATTLALLAAAAALGAGLAVALGHHHPSVILGTAPGGVAEMCLTATMLSLDVPLVTSLHLTRVLAAAAVTVPLFTVLRRMAGRHAP